DGNVQRTLGVARLPLVVLTDVQQEVAVLEIADLDRGHTSSETHASDATRRGEQRGARLPEQRRQLVLALGDLGQELVGDLVQETVRVLRRQAEHRADRALLQLLRDERE